MQARIQRGGRGSGGWNPPFFWPINAFEWEHIDVIPLYSGLGTPLFEMAGSATVSAYYLFSNGYATATRHN